MDSLLIPKPDYGCPISPPVHKSQTGEICDGKEILDVLTLTEPLACVLHAFKRLPTTFVAPNITVFGAGPMGILHVLEAKKQFPSAYIAIVEPNVVRRQLAARLLPFVSVYNSSDKIRETDISIVATSNPQAALNAIKSTTADGVVLLFSGYPNRHPGQAPRYEGYDLNAIHHTEEVRVTSHNVRLIGSLGHQSCEVGEAARQLIFMRGIYTTLHTGVIDGVGSFAIGGKDYGDVAVIRLLTDETLYTRHLKVVIRSDQRRLTESQIAISKDGVELRHFKLDMEVPPGMVRVRMRRMSISEADRLAMREMKRSQLKSGLILGREGVGVVEAVGPEVSRSLLQAVCILVPQYGSEPIADGSAIGSSSQLSLSRDRSGFFTTCGDFPASSVYPLELSLLTGEHARYKECAAALSPYD